MKRLIMGFAACALLMTSCTEQEIIENVLDGQGELTFSTGVGKQTTKTAELTNSALQEAAETNGVTVYVYQDMGTPGTPKWEDWFDDQVIHDGTKWKLKESARFRNQKETKFITYFSTGALTADFTDVDFNTKYPSFDYTVAANSATQEDLIAGVTVVKANQTNIVLGMRHILSQINFGTVGYAGAQIRIGDIEIKEVGSSATYTYRANEAGVVPNIIGEWSEPATKIASYRYFNNTNTEVGATGNFVANPHAFVPTDITKVMDVAGGDIYIFGDGGNAGPGRTSITWYPTSTALSDWKNADPTLSTGLKNSLMLLPQKLTDDAKVTFKYQITDVDNTYVVGGPGDDDWETGEFKLNFTTGDEVGKHYLGEWDQNFRYVYLIDFTDFLNGNALTFDVDVEMYPWENYDKDDENNGGVDIMIAGQPTSANMDAIDANDVWYIASQSLTKPDATKPYKWAQVVSDEVWNLSAYDFSKIESDGEFTLSFWNVIFNTKDPAKTDTKITLTLPNGYTAAAGTGISIDDTNAPIYVIQKGNKLVDATITITNDNLLQFSTPTTLSNGIAAAAINDELTYKGADAINLKGMEPTSLTTAGNTITVICNKVKPTVGATTNGAWTWNATIRTATWTHK